MATIDVGKLSFTHKGNYDASTAYVLNDVVYYNGSAYIAKTSTTGNLPTSTAHWNLFVLKGTDTSVLTTQGDVLYHDGSSLARLGAGTSGYFLKTQGAGANPVWGEVQAGMTSGTATTGSSSVITFTGIPSTAKLITIGWHEVQTSDSTALGFQLGHSGGITTSGYKGSAMYFYPSSNNGNVPTDGFWSISGSTSHVWSGISIISLIKSSGSDNMWSATNNFYLSDQTRFDVGGGSVDLGSNVLDRIRCQSKAGGTITAGTININYI